jgi:hypothetical protein
VGGEERVCGSALEDAESDYVLVVGDRPRKVCDLKAHGGEASFRRQAIAVRRNSIRRVTVTSVLRHVLKVSVITQNVNRV